MQVIHHIPALRQALAAQPQPRVLVPTMGNLHEGHLSLVRQARALGGTTVASIFVNRLQFLPHEDFDTYPRTLEADCDKLRSAGCDIVFAPSEAELYPEPQTYRVQPDPALADLLEGAFRPGFFTGVCTVVMKLFQCVQPSHAVFGQKDYQQLEVIRRMVRQFAMPIEIVAGATCRAGDGLALSSRNQYLDPAARQAAVQLSQALRSLATQVQQGARDFRSLEESAMAQLGREGWEPDYLTVRRRDTLLPPAADGLLPPLVALGAARIGGARLIDNLEF
ncbi:pantoate--beta-alanine ligase [Corticibacter populi]|uniref:Pantothenate synthetase n=1 Tax=Corticibacter populi TaxID=1550736 RepID=A0A3M6QZZ9_9BURK|nr:pantoate--beta-alanine ligase [Corticibacter populi]RMX08558.1 pantoate--beta-alanine ligase [Corticibacter populi]RZS35878.1 pantothenate synthetase [Corticibacter populi]